MLRISFLEFLNLFGSQNFAIKCFNSGVLLDTSEKSGLKNVMLFDQRSLCFAIMIELNKGSFEILIIISFSHKDTSFWCLAL